jgi:hypothetical protein
MASIIVIKYTIGAQEMLVTSYRSVEKNGVGLEIHIDPIA